jgi:hypothetical protein
MTCTECSLCKLSFQSQEFLQAPIFSHSEYVLKKPLGLSCATLMIQLFCCIFFHLYIYTFEYFDSFKQLYIKVFIVPYTAKV